MNKKGFTLIELLAVIIILGILMIIAIPSVTSYINDSRKSAYVDTAKEIVGGARNIVNEGKLGMYDTTVTYYIPAKYVNTENGLKSPYGEFLDKSAYIGVVYNGTGYKYYWISVDDAGQGVDEVTPIDKLDTDNIKSDLNPNDILDKIKTTGIGNRTDIKVLDGDTGIWEPIHLDDTSNNVSEDVGSGGTNNNPVSFSTDSWSTIAAAVRNNNTSSYHVGDTKEVDMGGFGIKTVRIANISSPSQCSNGNYSKTACGFVLEFSDIVFTNKIKSSPVGQEYSNNNYGGWEASDIRHFLNEYFYSEFPDDLKNVIINTKVVSGHGINDSENFVTTDKVYLLTPREIFGEYITNGSCNYWMEYENLNNYTRQLDFYNNSGLSCNNYNLTGAKKSISGNEYFYWLRSAPSNSYDYFYYILSDGSINTNDGSATAGISPAFRIG